MQATARSYYPTLSLSTTIFGVSLTSVDEAAAAAPLALPACCAAAASAASCCARGVARALTEGLPRAAAAVAVAASTSRLQLRGVPGADGWLEVVDPVQAEGARCWLEISRSSERLRQTRKRCDIGRSSPAVRLQDLLTWQSMVGSDVPSISSSIKRGLCLPLPVVLARQPRQRGGACAALAEAVAAVVARPAWRVVYANASGSSNLF